MKKIIVITALALTAFILSGCSDVTTNPSSYQNDTSVVEETQKRVQQSVPIPQIKTSAERKNIAKRAELFDNEGKVTYIYLVSYGKVMAFYSVQGKVSSLNSYMSPMDKLVDGNGRNCEEYTFNNGYRPCYLVGASDIDGAYGENADGVFFFTTEGAYVEWKGEYMVSDQPLKLTTQPELIREIK